MQKDKATPSTSASDKAFPTAVNDQITDAVTQACHKNLLEKIDLQQEIINQLKARITSQENIISQLLSKIPYASPITLVPANPAPAPADPYPSTYPYSPWITYTGSSTGATNSNDKKA